MNMQLTKSLRDYEFQFFLPELVKIDNLEKYVFSKYEEYVEYLDGELRGDRLLVPSLTDLAYEMSHLFHDIKIDRAEAIGDIDIGEDVKVLRGDQEKMEDYLSDQEDSLYYNDSFRIPGYWEMMFLSDLESILLKHQIAYIYEVNFEKYYDYAPGAVEVKEDSSYDYPSAYKMHNMAVSGVW